jgi:hypothetical protein
MDGARGWAVVGRVGHDPPWIFQKWLPYQHLGSIWSKIAYRMTPVHFIGVTPALSLSS